MANNESKVIISAEDRTRAAFDSIIRGSKSLQASFSALDSAAARLPVLGGALAAALGGATFTASIKGSIDFADHLNDLSQRVGISVENLARFKLAAAQSGTNLDDVAHGVAKLSKAMAEVPERFKAAGISTTDSTTALLQLSDVFAGLADGPQKTALALKLFGKAGTELIPLLNQGSAALKQQLGISGDLAKIYAELAPKADAFNDAMEVLKARFEQISVTLGLSVIPKLSEWVEQMNEGIRVAGSLSNAVFILGTSNPFREPSENVKFYRKELEGLQQDLERVKRSGSSDTSGLEQAINTSRIRFEFAKSTQRQQALAGSTPYRDEGSLFVKRDKTSAETSAEAAAKARLLLGATAEQQKAIDAYNQLIKTIKEKLAVQQAELGLTTKITDAGKEYASFLSDVTNGYLKLTPTQLGKAAVLWDEFLRNAEALQVKARQLAVDTAKLSIADLGESFGRDNALKQSELDVMPESQRRLLEALQAVDEKGREVGKSFRKMLADNKIDVGQYTALMGDLNDTLDTQKTRVRDLNDAQQRLNATWQHGADKALAAYLDSVQNIAAQSEQAFTHAFQGMEDALVEFATTGKLSFKGLADSIIADIARILVRQQITGPLAQSLNSGGGASGLIGSLLGFFGGDTPAPSSGGGGFFNGLKLPGKAKGGPVNAGMPYWVGEKGPELFQPRNSGTIIPNHALGGHSVSVVQHFNLSGQIDSRTRAQIAAETGLSVRRALARNT